MIKEYSFDDGIKYKVNPLIFQITMLILLLGLIIIYITYNDFIKESLYLKCEDKRSLGGVCENPLYRVYPTCAKYNLCDNQYLNNGFVLGTPPPPIFHYYPTIVIISFAIAFVINHLLYNKRLENG